jgi:flagellin
VAPHALEGVDINVRTEKNAREALRYADVALGLIAEARTEVGAQLAALENASVQARVQREGVTAARSRIQDADFAAETAKLTRAQILQQAGLASLAQANASPQAVLRLLG